MVLADALVAVKLGDDLLREAKGCERGQERTGSARRRGARTWLPRILAMRMSSTAGLGSCSPKSLSWPPLELNSSADERTVAEVEASELDVAAGPGTGEEGRGRNVP